MTDPFNNSAPPAFPDELEKWSLGRAAWQRHALWMLATKGELCGDDITALLTHLYSEVGLHALAEDAPDPTLFEAAHLKSKDAADVRLLGVAEIQNVNRLAPNGLTFAPDGLTIVYGDNGSGKTGFIRILRKACRSRIEKPQDLQILSNIYGPVAGKSCAKFLIKKGGQEVPIDWKDGEETDARLSSLSVFDTRSAQLYVDEGNRLRFLPADLDLPYRLNDVIMQVERRLSPEIASAQRVLDALSVSFDGFRQTGARSFVSALTSKTSDEAIDEACEFSAEDETELTGLHAALNAGPEKVAELTSVAASARALAKRINALEAALGSQARSELSAAWAAMETARQTHEATSALIAGKDPLVVGSQVWERLWEAAKSYAAEVDDHHHFPHDGPIGANGEIVCPLCQQSMEPAKGRLARFHDFMTSEAATAFDVAEDELVHIQDTLRGVFPTLGEAERVLVTSVCAQSSVASDSIEAFFSAAAKIHTAWLAYRGCDELVAALPPSDLESALTQAAADAETQATVVKQAQDATERLVLEKRRDELTDKKRISTCVKTLKDRRDALDRSERLAIAEASCRRNEVTRQANVWVDRYLTERAKEIFNEHLSRFRLQHLNVELERESTSIGTGFKNTISGGSGFTRVSDVLSEGEQRALSLAAFFTEAELERPGGTLIVDDPVSSLDRERSAAVAAQLVQEANSRQVIVFTHDLVFLEELGEAAKARDVEPTVVRVFSTRQAAGVLDPAGAPWKGQNLKQRVQYLKGELQKLSKIETTSRTDYEVAAKALYGRMRDAYERFVEERLFHNVITRFRSSIRTQELRYVTVPTDIAKRFHKAFSKASLHSHDNPAAQSVVPPNTTEISADIEELAILMTDVEDAQAQALDERGEMKP